jgi:hypothetical protein
VWAADWSADGTGNQCKIEYKWRGWHFEIATVVTLGLLSGNIPVGCTGRMLGSPNGVNETTLHFDCTTRSTR